MYTSPFARPENLKILDEINESSVSSVSCALNAFDSFTFPVFCLDRYNRSMFVMEKLKSRYFLHRSKSAHDLEKSPLYRSKSSPGSATCEMGNRRKIYPVRFSNYCQEK